MTGKFRVHFDGKVLVPDEPVDLPIGRSLNVRIESEQPAATEGSDRPLLDLAKMLAELPPVDDVDLPTDLAAQHDHYLYGTPKRP